jgi:hypothetical protein
MKRLLVAVALALAVPAVHAQQGPPPSPPAAGQQPADVRASATASAVKLDPGPHRKRMKHRGRHAGDPPFVDHSMDKLVVEPTRSTIILSSPTPP